MHSPNLALHVIRKAMRKEASYKNKEGRKQAFLIIGKLTDQQETLRTIVSFCRLSDFLFIVWLDIESLIPTDLLIHIFRTSLS